jgi:AAA+ superfamily predicted ATPase
VTDSKLKASDFDNELRQAIGDAEPIVLIESNDELRARESVMTCLKDSDLNATVWDLAHKPEDVSAEEHLFQQLVGQGPEQVVLALDAKGPLSDDRFARKVVQAIESGNSVRLIAVVDQYAPATALKPYIRHILLQSLPMEHTIKRVISTLKANGWSEPSQRKGLSGRLARIVRLIHGMPLVALDRTVKRIAQHAPDLGDSALDLVREARREQLRDLKFLEIYDTPPQMDNLAGLDILKEWLDNRKKVSQLGFNKQEFPTPRGMLLVGVPGCGKSLAAQVCAAAFNVPLLRLEFGKLRSGTEGAEHTLLKCLGEAERAAPCVLWLDEIDHALNVKGSRAENSGLVGTLASWLQEKSSQVFVAATANDATVLPPELVRKGRFDEIFFVDLPDPHERRSIIELHLNTLGHHDASFDLKKLVDDTRQFTGAELAAICREASVEAALCGEDLGLKHLLDAAGRTVPLVKTYETEIKAMRAWARSRARPASTHAGVLDLFDTSES